MYMQLTQGLLTVHKNSYHTNAIHGSETHPKINRIKVKIAHGKVVVI